jgi:protein-L-isoaspartate(D-aspartate) O-methyltransferase
MDSVSEPVHRRLYAQQILAKAGVADNDRLLAAFAGVARETFVGAPPWFFDDFSGYRPVPSADPVVLYQDVLVGLDTGRGVNNGMPSLHAAALHALGVREGETVVHLGAGAGYYSAIIASLVGPSGRVIAVEYDAALAKRAEAALAGYGNVEVVQGDATGWPQEKADVLYANFALDHPPQAWIEGLAEGGRLLFPFGFPGEKGTRGYGYTAKAGFLLIDRRPAGFGARFLQPVSFVWAEGQQPAPPTRHSALQAAFRTRRALQVRSLRWRTPQNAGGEWYGEDDWGLSFEEP